MIYNFNVPNKSDNKTMKLLNKIDNINFVDSHKKIIVPVLSLSIFVLITLLQDFDIHIFKAFKEAFLFKFLFSISFSLFLVSLYNLILNENAVYKKLSKKLNCTSYIKNILITSSNDNEDLDGVSIPSIDILYDTTNNNGTTAVLMKIDDKRFKVLKILDNEYIGNNKKERISSLMMKNSLEELDNLDEIIILYVCNLKNNNNENDYIEAEDIDIVSIVTESFFIENN